MVRDCRYAFNCFTLRTEIEIEKEKINLWRTERARARAEPKSQKLVQCTVYGGDSFMT